MSHEVSELAKRRSRPESFANGITSVLATANETRLDELLHALPAAIFTTDQDRRVTFYNEAAATLWGFHPALHTDEWSRSWRLFRPDGSPLPHAQYPIAIALQEQRSINGMEVIVERPDGTRAPFLAFPSPLRDSSGTVIGALNMLVEIADRKNGEEVAQRLAAIVESSDDAIVSKDLNGVVSTWNKGAEQLFGYTPEEMIGKPISTLIPPDRENEEPLILDRIRRGERIDHYDTVRKRKDGSLVDISLTVSPVRDGNGRVVGASKIARNITERKRQEAFISLLSREVDHRAKNLLAVVQATVNLTEGDTPEAVKSAISGRIHALANAHNLLASSRWEGASLEVLARQELAPYCGEDNSRVLIGGPSQTLGPKAAQAIAIMLHELATNAAKYGALSVATGQVYIEWSVTRDKSLALRWIEKGGPQVTPPARQGFGTRVIKMMANNQMSGEVQFGWHSDGLICDVTIPAAQLHETQ